MARLTGTGELDFRNIDDADGFFFFPFISVNGPDLELMSGAASVRFVGPFTTAPTEFGAEDQITRIEIDTGAGANGVIKNVGVSDFDLGETFYFGTLLGSLAFVLGGNDKFNLAASHDWVDGFAGDDDIRARGGNDTVHGSEGDDTLRGGPGQDDLFGGSGNDSLLGQSGSDALVGNSGDDNLKGGGGNDLLGGGSGDDFLKGGTGSDFMSGGSGNDRLFGNADADQILGGRGADNLNGGGGNDALIGGRGNDTLKGGAGSDLFVFAKTHGNDVINDFDATDNGEVIDFSANNDFNNFGDVRSAMVQIGDDVLITTGSNSSILLRDVDISDLDANDFTF